MKLALLLAALTLSGCAAMGLGPTPLRLTPQIESSEFETSTKITGVEARLSENDPWSRQFLRSWIDKKTGEVTHQLYVFQSYAGDWRFWQGANGEDAQSLPFTEISRDVGSCAHGCTLYESFGVSLPDTLLRAHAAGYRVKAYAKSGLTMVVFVSPEQIASQLQAVASAKAAK
jgi:hypothetical protein